MMKRDPFPVEAGRELRRRHSGAGPVEPIHISTTQQRALSYEPGAIRVRFTVFRDILTVVRSRYMDGMFQASAILLLLQLLRALWHARRVQGITYEALVRAPFADVCSLFSEELRWALPMGILMVCTLLLRRNRSVYLLDFSLFEPPETWCVSQAQILDMMRQSGRVPKGPGTPQPFNEEDLAFMAKVLGNTGTGESTAWPPGILDCLRTGGSQDESMAAARQEAEAVIFTCLDDLFAKTHVKPKEVDFLVINCSLFSPTPSLCAMVCNRFKMRSNVRTYNLGGQGCSASLLSVDLASELLQNNPNSIAVVVSTESITQSLYHGHAKSHLLQNTLFRCGGAAVLLTNKPRLVWHAKYMLRHLVRTQACDDTSYEAVYQCEDDEGHCGVRLSKEIVKVAGNVMKTNLTQLGPLILPISEQVKVIYSLVKHRFGGPAPKYVPKFKSAIHFFCIHAGGRGVLDGIEKALHLTPADMMPSRSVLRAYGNTSSSSIWYELRYIEENMPLRRGHKVLQLAFGSGFKCNSAVWTRLR